MDEEDEERIPLQEELGENLSGDVHDSLKKDDVQAEDTSQDEIDDFEDGVEEIGEEEREGKKVLLTEFSSLVKEIEKKSKRKKTKTSVFEASNSCPDIQHQKVNLS